MRFLLGLALPFLCLGAGDNSGTEITRAWSEVLGEPAAARPSAGVASLPGVTGSDILDHLFVEIRTGYIHEGSSFTGQPTATGLINAEPGSLANPSGIPFPGAFQPDANTVYGYLDFGTRGWLSARVDSNFSIRYRQSLTPVDPASPALDLLTTYRGNRRLEMLAASVDVHGLASDGVLAGTSLRVGRQYVYGADLAAFDGASLSANRSRYSLTLYGGRRFSQFGDPLQRAIGGGNFWLRVDGSSSLEYQGLVYSKASQSLTYRKKFVRDWFLTSYLRAVGASPVDFSSQLLYLSRSGKTTARVAFFQKLTNKDFIYDYTIAARDLDAHNPLARLNLGPISPFTQIAFDAHRNLTSRLRAGGLVWIRHLNNAADQSAFDTSFADYRANAQVFPWRQSEVDFEYHRHDSRRGQPFGATFFDDISRAGETRVQDVTAEVRRPFAEGKFTLSVGGYYRTLDFQDQFQSIAGTHDRGLLGSAWYRFDARTRVWADYTLDTDFLVFRPDIRHSTILRVGVDWKY